MNTITVELINSGALQLLHDLETLNIIKIKKSENGEKLKLSEKYRGTLSKEQGEDLNKHIEQMRSEWNNL